MGGAKGSAVAVGDAAAGEVVGGELDPDAVARQDTDEEFAHAARDVGQHAVAVLELDLERGVGEGFLDDGVKLDVVGSWHQLSVCSSSGGARSGRRRRMAYSPKGPRSAALRDARLGLCRSGLLAVAARAAAADLGEAV